MGSWWSVPTQGPLPTVEITASPEPILEETITPDICLYEVVGGDSLWSVSAEFDVSIGEILSENGISDPDYIQIGQTLTIPGGYREGCLVEIGDVEITEPPTPPGGVEDFSRAPLTDAFISGWEHGEDENEEFEISGCRSTRTEDQHCFHPGYDISTYNSDHTLRANTDGVVRFYQTYENDRGNVVTVEYDPDDPVDDDDLRWFGNYAVLESEIDGETYYQIFAHMDGFDEDIESGAHIDAGTAIGEMGSSGNSRGPHVHWEIRTESGYRTSGNGNFADFYPDSTEELEEDFVDPLDFEEWIQNEDGG